MMTVRDIDDIFVKLFVTHRDDNERPYFHLPSTSKWGIVVVVVAAAAAVLKLDMKAEPCMPASYI